MVARGSASREVTTLFHWPWGEVGTRCPVRSCSSRRSSYLHVGVSWPGGRGVGPRAQFHAASEVDAPMTTSWKAAKARGRHRRDRTCPIQQHRRGRVVAYGSCVEIRQPVPAEQSQAFTEVALGSRLTWHMVQSCDDPIDGSNFMMANRLYPFEKVSDRARHYVRAAFEHLLMWADYVAPSKFHPEQAVTFTLRPTYTLARAAMETAAQVVWLLDTTDPVECVRRHLRLIRWDLSEHRKSFLDADGKKRVRERDNELLTRVAEVFNEEDLRPPNGYLDVLKYACNPDDLDLDEATVERLWRAASGAAHGMYWPNLELQTLTLGAEYEPSYFRAQAFPDATVMVDVIQVAYKMSQYAALKYINFSGANPTVLIKLAMQWLAANTTLKKDIDADTFERLTGGHLPGPAQA